MIGFAGLSHLGIVSSIAVASKGFDVVGYDSNPELCKDLNAGRLPILEPDLPELLAANKSRLQFTDDLTVLNKCNLIFFSKDVPTDECNKSNLSPLNELIDEVIPHVAQGSVLVVSCQVPPGFTRKRFSSFKPFLKEKGIIVFYQVETLIFGRAVERALYPERYIVGCNNPQDSLPPQYAELLEAFNCPILPMGYESAELTKVAINLYLFNSVAYANTIADLCEAYNADMNEIIPALRLDKRIGQHAYIQPSLGVAGGNLERDMVTLAQLEKDRNIKPGLIDLLIKLNGTRYKWIERQLNKYLFPKVPNPKIVIWGVAYKRNTDSIKNSIAIKVIHDLSVNITFIAYDPIVKSIEYDGSVKICNDRYETLDGAHCLIVLTDPDEFRDLDLDKVRSLMQNPLVLDCVNLYPLLKEEPNGIEYIAIGRSTKGEYDV